MPRGEVLHLRAYQYLPAATADIAAFFAPLRPAHIEWLNAEALNVVFGDAGTAHRALELFSEKVPRVAGVAPVDAAWRVCLRPLVKQKTDRYAPAGATTCIYLRPATTHDSKEHFAKTRGARSQGTFSRAGLFNKKAVARDQRDLAAGKGAGAGLAGAGFAMALDEGGGPVGGSVDDGAGAGAGASAGAGAPSRAAAAAAAAAARASMLVSAVLARSLSSAASHVRGGMDLELGMQVQADMDEHADEDEDAAGADFAAGAAGEGPSTLRVTVVRGPRSGGGAASSSSAGARGAAPVRRFVVRELLGGALRGSGHEDGGGGAEGGDAASLAGRRRGRDEDADDAGAGGGGDGAADDGESALRAEAEAGDAEAEAEAEGAAEGSVAGAGAGAEAGADDGAVKGAGVGAGAGADGGEDAGSGGADAFDVDAALAAGERLLADDGDGDEGRRRD
jgi:hypothetical protein